MEGYGITKKSSFQNLFFSLIPLSASNRSSYPSSPCSAHVPLPHDYILYFTLCQHIPGATRITKQCSKACYVLFWEEELPQQHVGTPRVCLRPTWRNIRDTAQRQCFWLQRSPINRVRRKKVGRRHTYFFRRDRSLV